MTEIPVTELNTTCTYEMYGVQHYLFTIPQEMEISGWLRINGKLIKDYKKIDMYSAGDKKVVLIIDETIIQTATEEV